LNGCLAAGTGLNLSAKQTTNLDHSDLSTMKGGRQSLTRKKQTANGSNEFHRRHFLFVTSCRARTCGSCGHGKSFAQMCNPILLRFDCSMALPERPHGTIRVTQTIASRASCNARHFRLHDASRMQARFARKNKCFANIVLQRDCKHNTQRACAFDEKQNLKPKRASIIYRSTFFVFL